MIRYKLSRPNLLGGTSSTKVSRLWTDGTTTFHCNRKKSCNSPHTFNRHVGVLAAVQNGGVGQELIRGDSVTNLKPLPRDGESQKDRRAGMVEDVESAFADRPEGILPVARRRVPPPAELMISQPEPRASPTAVGKCDQGEARTPATLPLTKVRLH